MVSLGGWGRLEGLESCLGLVECLTVQLALPLKKALPISHWAKPSHGKQGKQILLRSGPGMVHGHCVVGFVLKGAAIIAQLLPPLERAFSAPLTPDPMPTQGVAV